MHETHRLLLNEESWKPAAAHSCSIFVFHLVMLKTGGCLWTVMLGLSLRYVVLIFKTKRLSVLNTPDNYLICDPFQPPGSSTRNLQKGDRVFMLGRLLCNPTDYSVDCTRQAICLLKYLMILIFLTSFHHCNKKGFLFHS